MIPEGHFGATFPAEVACETTLAEIGTHLDMGVRNDEVES
jgi:hypothetical protein